MYLEKQKMEKGDKPKKGKGAKGKAKLRMEGDVSLLFHDSILWKVKFLINFSLFSLQDDYFTQANKNNFDDEYDDFM